MSKRLVIVGAGGFGREVHGWVRSSPLWAEKAGISEIVFVDDKDPDIAVRADLVSTVRAYVPGKHDLAICAIGSPKIRKAVVDELAGRGGHFATFVHDLAILGDAINLGAGAVVCPRALLSSDVQVGDHVHINTGSSIGHDVSIGDFATLSSACNLAGGVVLGDGAFLGTAVTVIPGVQVGVNAYLGAGSVVIRDVPANTTVFGNPSRTVGKRPE